MSVKKNLQMIISLLMALIFLPGCGRITNREYNFTSEHTQGYIEQTEGDALVVESYKGLKDAILYFIYDMADSGTIRLKNYPGDVEQDVSAACLDVIRDEPIGAFCVDYITHELSRIVSYYELTVNFTYSRSVDQIKKLVPVYSLEKAKEAFVYAYQSREETLLLRCYYYENWADELINYMKSLYYELPSSALLMPELSYELYPSEGEQRILEVNFVYDTTPEVQTQRMKVLRTLANDLVKELDLKPKTEDPESVVNSLFALYSWLSANVRYDFESEEKASLDDTFKKNIYYTAYGALYGKAATSEGFALTFDLICNILGVECQIIQGRRSGYSCCWNIVTIEDASYHVDSSSFSYSDPASGFMRSDESFSNVYRWNLSNYPICVEDWPSQDYFSPDNPQGSLNGSDTPQGSQP